MSVVVSGRGSPESYPPATLLDPLILSRIPMVARKVESYPPPSLYSPSPSVLALVRYRRAERTQKDPQETRPRAALGSVQFKVIPFIPHFCLIPALGKTAASLLRAESR